MLTRALLPIVILEPKHVNMEFPELNYPVFVYPFESVRIKNGKDFANGVNIQAYAHVEDVFNDRFKLSICGTDDNEFLVEHPLIPHPIIHQEKAQKHAFKKCGAFDSEIYDHECGAKTDMVSDKSRHQGFTHFKFRDGEGGPLRELEVTTGLEADYNMASFSSSHKPGSKEYEMTTTVIQWKLVFTDSIIPIKQQKNITHSKGKSKLERMEEGMDNLTIAESRSEG